MIVWDRGYKKVHLQLDSLAAVTAILGNQGDDSRHGRTLLPLMSFVVETGKSPFPTFFAKATKLLICLPTIDIPLILVFMLIVPIPVRLIKLSGVTM
ncbi:hypothetical protein LINPERHAP2_LOCUS14206 [Linum perenne]